VHAEPNATELHGSHTAGRLEVAVFVEHVIGGQQALVPSLDHAPLVAQRRRVVQLLAGGFLIAIDKPYEDAQPIVRQPGQPIHQLQVGVHELDTLQQITRRIAGGRQLRKHDQIRTICTGVGDGFPHPREVRVECANGEVELGKRDAHR
jgi:hypothetical protein